VNRRTLETVIVVVVLMQPVFGLVRMWRVKTFNSTTPGSLAHSTAELAATIAP
jgi:hypothetical protein